MSKTILLVEDDTSVRTILKNQLLRVGYEIVEADHGEKGLLIISTKLKPDLIILDLMMPIIDGYKFIKEIKENFDDCADIPIIVLSAKDDKESVLKAIQLGCSDYIIKPFKIEEVFQKVKKLLSE